MSGLLRYISIICSDSFSILDSLVLSFGKNLTISSKLWEEPSEPISYHIIRTRRIKTSEVIVDADTVTVRTPYDKDKTEIQRLVLDKASWILKKQKEYRETKPELIKPSFKENTTLPYSGKNYSLIINKNQATNNIEVVDGKFEVNVVAA